MSKIAEKKALEAYPICNDMTDFQRQYERYAFSKGYDQAMKDFLEKACEWLKHAEGYIVTSEGGDSSMDCTFIEDFKNYMQDE